MGTLADFITQHPAKRWLADRATGYRRDIARVYSEYVRLERASVDEIEQYQTRSLRWLLRASQQSPYYKYCLDSFGVDPEQFTLDDLGRFPFLTKKVMRQQKERLRLPDAKGVYENYSGGSTGAPTRFWQDYPFKVHLSVATRRCNEMAGAFPGARVAKLWGAPQDKKKIEGWRGRLKLWLLNQRYYDTFDMGHERMQEYHEAMHHFQPDLIQAYTSSLYLLARYLKSNGIRPDYPGIGMIAAAEKLSPHVRKAIEEVFPARVFDRYGSREVPAVAAECACHNGLHIQMPGYIVETIDPATEKPIEGKPGEIVVTALNNNAMPFIRYRIGDMGILTKKPCACGMSYWRLEQVIGRTSDNFLMPDGRIVHGEYFTHLFYGREGIEQFQFVQETRERFTLRIVPTLLYSRQVSDQIEREVREMIGHRSDLRVEIREEIPKAPSGKYRFTMSHVSLEELAGGREG